MQKSGDDTTEQSLPENPPACLRQCAGGEILWLGAEVMGVFLLGKRGLVLVQRNAWSAGSHKLEWVSPASLQPIHGPLRNR
jgi:hypothetical protein